MADSLAEHYIENALKEFRGMKALADKAVAQVSDEDFFRTIDAESNSIALIMKHMAGNMRSRWTDFLTSDGEKPTRDRDSEFVDPPGTRESLLVLWNEAWELLFRALEPLTDAELGRTVKIRGEAHSVMQAVNRQLTHYAYHSGQIVMLAKHLSHSHWKTLSIPRNRSVEFNRRVLSGESSQR